MSPTQLQIKVKAIERLTKEKKLYAQEVEDQRLLLKDMIAKEDDAYDIRKQEEVLAESEKMIPELESKIRDHKANLVLFLESYDGEEDTSTATKLVT